jgi:hypothetical protein
MTAPGPHSRDAALTTWFDLASTPHRAGHSVDLRLFFRVDPDTGAKSSEMVYLRYKSGSRLKHGEDAMKALVELKSPEEVGAFFEELARRGFEQAERAT